MAKKGKKGGNAAKGEKIFKNLCAVCHSLAVSIFLHHVLFVSCLNIVLKPSGGQIQSVLSFSSQIVILIDC